MKNFKRIASIFLVIAMAFSLVSFSAFAEGNTITPTFKIVKNDVEVSSVKQGDTVRVSVYVPAAKYGYSGFMIKWGSNVSVGNLSAGKVVSDYISLVSSTLDVSDGSAVISVDVTINDNALGETELLTVVGDGYTSMNTEGDVNEIIVNEAVAKVNVLKAFTANAAVASEATRTVGLGTSQADAVKGITAKVTDGTNEEEGYAVSDWTSEPAYDANKAGVYTFKGDVVIDGEGAANAGKLTQAVTVVVTVDKIALDEEAVKVVAEPEAKTYQKTEEATTKTAEEIATELNADTAYNTVEVKKDGTEYKENVKVTWAKATDSASSLDLTKVTAEDGNSANVVKLTGTLNVTADNKNFKDGESAKTISMDVTVVPAEIKGGVIEVKNVGASSKASVKVTVPAAEVAKLTTGDKVVATIWSVKDGNLETEKVSAEETVSQTDIDNAKNADDPVDFTTTIKFDKKMNDDDINIAAGNQFAVQVKVDGTLLLNGDTDEYVTAKVLNVSNSPATGIPSGNGGNSGNKDDKKDDAATTPDDDKKDDTTPTPDDDKKDDTTPGTDAPATGFNDVPADHWAADFIKVLADAGIINGDEDGNFNTEGKITRAEFTKMVAVLFGLEIKDDATVDFSDCGEDDWFVKYVAAAVEAGYINGVGEGTFAPNDTISREDACTILGRALGLAAENANLNFADADAVADYAAQYIALLSELGFINGYEDGTFAPKNEITRAEAAKIIAGIYADKNAAANAGDNTEAEAETETETDAEAEVEEEVEAEK